MIEKVKQRQMQLHSADCPTVLMLAFSSALTSCTYTGGLRGYEPTAQ
jgi:hypothetical protein